MYLHPPIAFFGPSYRGSWNKLPQMDVKWTEYLVIMFGQINGRQWILYMLFESIHFLPSKENYSNKNLPALVIMIILVVNCQTLAKSAKLHCWLKGVTESVSWKPSGQTMLSKFDSWKSMFQCSSQGLKPFRAKCPTGPRTRAEVMA